MQLQTIVDFRKNIFDISDKILQLPKFSEIPEITFSKFPKFSGNSETQLSTSRKNCATPEKILRHSGKKFATCHDIPKKNFQTLRHLEKKVWTFFALPKFSRDFLSMSEIPEFPEVSGFREIGEIPKSRNPGNPGNPGNPRKPRNPSKS